MQNNLKIELHLIKLTSQESFIDKVSVPFSEHAIGGLFKPFLDNIGTYAIGPFNWFILDNSTLRVIATRVNMN